MVGGKAMNGGDNGDGGGGGGGRLLQGGRGK